MTRDANKQSVTRCDEYQHDWTNTNLPELENHYSESQNPKRFVCAKCGKNPKRSEVESIDAVLELRKLIKPGQTVYTILRSVSRSGMQRVIDVHVIQDCEPRWIGYLTAKALGDRFDDRKQGIVVGGCGMDMGFHVVYNLSRMLFRGGFGCIGKGDNTQLEQRRNSPRCPSNDHSNGDRDYTPHENHVTSPDHICATEPETCTAKKHWHNDGGYALRHQWL